MLKSKGNHPIKFIDLFARIGSFRKGFETIGLECVFTSKHNKFPIQPYIANFEQNHPIEDDITQINANTSS